MPLDPAVWTDPAMRVALGERDITTVYRRLVAAGLNQRQIGELTGQRPSEVSEIVNGRAVQSIAVLERIATGLGVPRGWMGLAYAGGSEGYLAGASDAPQEVDEDVKRRVFLGAASVALWDRPVLGELLELPTRPVEPTPLPSRLVAADVDALQDLTTRMRAVARQWGGQADTTSAIARRATRLMRVPAAPSVRTRLASVLAELHTEAGWCCFDSGMPREAEQHFGRALELGDPFGVAYTLRHAGIMYAERGHYNDGLKLLQIGQIRLSGVHEDARVAPLAAWFHAETAVAFARMANAKAARTALARARDGWRPPDTFDRADMDYAAAWVLSEIGDDEGAEPFAATSVRAWTASVDRRDAIKAEISLAAIHVRTGEPDGPTLAHRAIDGVSELRSARARARLAPLVDALDARSGDDARELARMARQVASTPA